MELGLVGVEGSPCSIDSAFVIFFTKNIDIMDSMIT